MIRSRIDPSNSRQNLYRVFNPLSRRHEAWTVVELAYRSFIDKKAMQWRLDHWTDEEIMEPILDHWFQTADYRAGLALHKRIWVDEPGTIGPPDKVDMRSPGGRRQLFPTKSIKRARARGPSWCGFYEPCKDGVMGFESVADAQSFRAENPKRGPGRPRVEKPLAPPKRHRRASPRVLTPPGHKCVYGLRQELIGKRDPAPDWARFLVPCAQGVMAFEGEDDAAIYRLLQADTRY